MEQEQENQMSFLDHLEALRWHLIRSIVAIVIVAVAAFIFKDIVFDQVILAPMQTNFATYRFMCYLDDLLSLGGVICIESIPFTLFNLEMSGQFTTHITISVFTGLVLAFPYVFWELWSFIRPGLLEKEQRYVRGVVFFASLLFFIGVAFGYFVIAPLSINFLGSYQVSTMVDNQINLGSYVSTVTSITLAAAIVFELPIVVYFLTKAGFITPSFMKSYRRHAFVSALILGAIITPPDVTSQLLVMLPLVILYELSIFISAYVLREKVKAANIKKIES
jgi:sec-independent protein translocase protein TatC